MIDFVGKVDGEAFEGGAAEDYPLVLGSNSFIPGFEEQLVGREGGRGEGRSRSPSPRNTRPSTWPARKPSSTCTVKAVKAPEAAEVDDELAKQFGAETSTR